MYITKEYTSEKEKNFSAQKTFYICPQPEKYHSSLPIAGGVHILLPIFRNVPAHCFI